MPNQTPLQALGGQTKFKLDRKVAERLAALDKTHVLAMERLNELSQNDLRRIWDQGQKRALTALKSAPNADAIADVVEPTRAELAQAAGSQKTTLKNGLREISKEAHEIAGPEIRRFVLVAAEHLGKLAAGEQELADSFAVAHQPSPLLARLNAEVARLEEQVNRPWAGAIHRPASLIETFTTLN